MIASGIIYALEQQGYQVTHCTGVRDAVNALRLHSFPLAILDMQLADGSGSDINR